MCTKIFLYLLRLIIAWSLSPSTLPSPRHGIFSLHVYTGFCEFKSTSLAWTAFLTFITFQKDTPETPISDLSDSQSSAHSLLACLLVSSVRATSIFHTPGAPNIRDIKSHHRCLPSPSSSLPCHSSEQWQALPVWASHSTQHYQVNCLSTSSEEEPSRVSKPWLCPLAIETVFRGLVQESQRFTGNLGPITFLWTNGKIIKPFKDSVFSPILLSVHTKQAEGSSTEHLKSTLFWNDTLLAYPKLSDLRVF